MHRHFFVCVVFELENRQALFRFCLNSWSFDRLEKLWISGSLPLKLHVIFFKKIFIDSKDSPSNFRQGSWKSLLHWKSSCAFKSSSFLAFIWTWSKHKNVPHWIFGEISSLGDRTWTRVLENWKTHVEIFVGNSSSC